MQFDIVTIFPEMFESYFSSSILKRAQDEGYVKINAHQLRNYTEDKHHTVDDTPYGGGAGMVMKAEPIIRAVEDIRLSAPGTTARVLLTSAKGKILKQADMQGLQKSVDQVVIICGRYEGVDERVMSVVDGEVSIGEYVLTGGELPAMVIIDSVSRLIPGVLGNETSFQDESHSTEGVLEYPHYTRPEELNGMRVPNVLLSGNHAEIEEWRNKQRQSS